MSKAQIDRLGERLRKGPPSDADLRQLDEYRRTYSASYQRVTHLIRRELALEPTGRPAKSTTAIIEKLRRESIRLTQMQDVAGCRVVVDGIVRQDAVVQQLMAAFPSTSLIDRRERPSHGYRAVHVVVLFDGLPIEVQVRTALQHLWAELSEKFSDVIDPAIKYGGGERSERKVLDDYSDIIARQERLEQEIAMLAGELAEGSRDDELRHRAMEMHARLATRRTELARFMEDILESIRESQEED